jgi:hypothetical protein
MQRTSSLAALAALLQSPSLEGLDSWDTIQPDLLPDFTPRFTQTAGGMQGLQMPLHPGPMPLATASQ